MGDRSFNFGSFGKQDEKPQGADNENGNQQGSDKLQNFLHSDAFKIGAGVLGAVALGAAVAGGVYAYKQSKVAKERNVWESEARENAAHIFTLEGQNQLPPVFWRFTKGSSIPRDAIPAGSDKDGNTYFVGRTWYDKGVYIGKAGKHFEGVYLAIDGKERHIDDDFEILCGNPNAVRWVPASGNVSAQSNGLNVIDGGNTRDGVEIYIAQADFQGNVVPGYAGPNTNGVWFPYDGEKTRPDFKVLVHA